MLNKCDYELEVKKMKKKTYLREQFKKWNGKE